MTLAKRLRLGLLFADKSAAILDRTNHMKTVHLISSIRKVYVLLVQLSILIFLGLLERYIVTFEQPNEISKHCSDVYKKFCRTCPTVNI